MNTIKDKTTAKIWSHSDACDSLEKMFLPQKWSGFKKNLSKLGISVPEGVYYPHKSTNLLLFFLYQAIKDNPNLKTALDVGAGSGIHSIFLAQLGLQVTATDISEQACQAIMENASANGVEGRVKAVTADLLSGLGNTYDLLVANLATSPTPPAGHPLHYLSGGPAIDGGFDGRLYLDQVLNRASTVLSPQGILFVSQTNVSNPEKTEEILKSQGYDFKKVAFLTEAGEHTIKLNDFLKESFPPSCHLKVIDGRYYYEILIFVAKKS